MSDTAQINTMRSQAHQASTNESTTAQHVADDRFGGVAGGRAGETPGLCPTGAEGSGQGAGPTGAECPRPDHVTVAIGSDDADDDPSGFWDWLWCITKGSDHCLTPSHYAAEIAPELSGQEAAEIYTGGRVWSIVVGNPPVMAG